MLHLSVISSNDVIATTEKGQCQCWRAFSFYTPVFTARDSTTCCPFCKGPWNSVMLMMRHFEEVFSLWQVCGTGKLTWNTIRFHNLLSSMNVQVVQIFYYQSQHKNGKPNLLISLSVVEVLDTVTSHHHLPFLISICYFSILTPWSCCSIIFIVFLEKLEKPPQKLVCLLLAFPK